MTETVYYDHHHHEEVEPSALSNLWYDEVKERLYVQFRESGAIAGYAGVAAWTYKHLLRANSIGTFYNTQIKSNYAGLTGDVYLVKRPEPPVTVVDPPPAANGRYTVKVQVNGLCHFVFDAATTPTEDDAIEMTNEYLDQLLPAGGTTGIVSVERTFGE